ncbi:MAG: DNA-formamidopyrimidine glycosylase family protein [Acidimicrobiales bacterium]|jgi:endonuclease-8
MPEGDTIHRTANRLRPLLEGQSIVRFEAQRLTGDRPQAGDTIQGVEAVGKNLLVRFPKRLVLHTHMKMTGSWHLYRPHEKWQEPAHLARAVIEIADWVAVCFAAPTVRTWRDIDGQPNPLSHLGPDLCLPDVDIDLVVARVANIAETATSIADVLLDQRMAAGIGNVYKSETLWACQISPFAPIQAIDDETQHRLFATAARQLQANLTTPTRMTVAGGLGVYGRQRQPCRRCRSTIQLRNHGDQARSTYWCPTCQPGH